MTDNDVEDCFKNIIHISNQVYDPSRFYAYFEVMTHYSVLLNIKSIDGMIAHFVLLCFVLFKL